METNCLVILMLEGLFGLYLLAYLCVLMHRFRCHLHRPSQSGSMSLVFKEITSMELHANSKYDLSGVTLLNADGTPATNDDGSPATATDLVIESDSDAVTVETDPDNTDNESIIDTGDAGGTANISGTCAGSNGKNYAATPVAVTLVPKETPIGSFSLQFTEVAA